MATFKTAVLEFDEVASFENLTSIDPNAVLMIVSDKAGNKQFLKLNTDAIRENETAICNTKTGMCLKLIGGQWVWVPC